MRYATTETKIDEAGRALWAHRGWTPSTHTRAGKWATWLMAVAVLAGPGRSHNPLPAAEPGLAGTIIWKNGDEMPGRLLDGEGAQVRWQSDVFPEPFCLDLQWLSWIKFAGPESPARSEAGYRAITCSNDVLTGALEDITDDSVLLRSPRHGQVRLLRSGLIGLQRNDPQAGRAIGLEPLSDWRTLHRGRKLDEWQTSPEGHIATRIMGAELFRDLHLTAVTDIELALSWRDTPGFLISFAGPEALRLPKEVVKLETWDSDLVLQTLGSNGDFAVIDTLGKDTKILELRLQWNPQSGELVVYTAGGRLLGRLQGGDVASRFQSGLYLQNKGSDLSLVRLNVNNLGGIGVAQRVEGITHLHLENDKTLSGRIVRFDRAGGQLDMELASGGRRRIPLTAVASIDFGSDRRQQEAEPPVQVGYFDGTQVSGSLVSLRESRMELQTRYASQPIVTHLDGVSRIKFSASSPPPGDVAADTLYIGKHQWRGYLSATITADSAVSWKPLGATNASPFPPDAIARIVRAATGRQEEADHSPLRDCVFLRNGDMVPCSVVAIDDLQLHVEIPMTEVTRIARADVKAVTFRRTSEVITDGFADPGWTISNLPDGKPDRPQGGISFIGSGTVSYRDMSRAGEISFDIDWTDGAQGIVYVNLFAPGATELTGNVSLLIYRSSNARATIQRGPAYPGQQHANAELPIRNRRTHVTLQIKPGKVDVVDEQHALLSLPYKRGDLTGRRFTIATQPMGFGGMGGAAGEDRLLTISNLRITTASGSLASLPINPDEMLEILTVPRFRQQSPPTEILVGQNGDLLRGRLVALSADRVTFLSQLDEMSIPRERLIGVVWLSDESPGVTSPPDHGQQMRIRFDDDTELRLWGERLVDGVLVGRHPVLGTSAVPLDMIRELEIGRFSDRAAQLPFADWTARPAIEPRFETASPGSGASDQEGTPNPGRNARLRGTHVEDLALGMLDGQQFLLSDHADRIVILDFWATWCGPCVRMMPTTLQTVAAFPANKVTLLAVNQQESPDVIRQFLEARQWTVNVALDPDGAIARRFGVDAIPQLVVIAPGGTVAMVHVGASADADQLLRRTIQQLLD